MIAPTAGAELGFAQVLVVQHEDECPPHLLGDWLRGAGLDLDVRRPDLGDPLPVDLSGHDALVVLGGSMGAYDDDDAPWLPVVRGLIERAAEEAVPTLGVCLGHQLIAVALGGRVAVNPRGRLVGILPVGWRPDAAADPLLVAMPSLPSMAVQWNQDLVVGLPDGAVLLAATAAGEVQAVRFADTVWGVQVHPEADHALATRWAHSEPSPHAEAALADLSVHQGAVAAQWAGLGEAFATVVDASTAIDPGEQVS